MFRMITGKTACYFEGKPTDAIQLTGHQKTGIYGNIHERLFSVYRALLLLHVK